MRVDDGWLLTDVQYEFGLVDGRLGRCVGRRLTPDRWLGRGYASWSAAVLARWRVTRPTEGDLYAHFLWSRASRTVRLS